MSKSLNGFQYLRSLAVFFALLLMLAASADPTRQSIQGSGTILSWKFKPIAELKNSECHSEQLNTHDWPAFEIRDLKAQSHVCLRATFVLNETSLPQKPILLVALMGAYDVYIDGNYLGSNGEHGASAQEEKAGPITQILPLTASQLSPGEHRLSLAISTFRTDPNLSTIGHLIAISDEEAIYDTIINITIVTALIIGALGILAFIFAMLYLNFNKDVTFRLFALLCLLTITLLVAEQWKLWADYHYDDHVLRLSFILINTFALTLLLPVFYLYQHKFDKKRFWLVMIVVSQTVSIVILSSYDKRSESLFIIAFAFVLAINMMAMRKGKPFAKFTTATSAISLLLLLVAPTLFTEVGFGFATCLLMSAIGLSLLQQLKVYRDQALETGRIRGELLRKNLQPHYLMNCLMQLQELIDSAPAQANEFVTSIANEFRDLVKMSNQDLVSLQDEVALCKHHLKIMAIRYQQTYQLEVLLDNADTQTFMVPSAIIHSQIENCFTHNRIAQNKHLTLKASKKGKRLCIELLTPMASVIDHQGLGIGEAYIRAKLNEVCEQGWELTSAENNSLWITRYSYTPKINLIKAKEKAISL